MSTHEKNEDEARSKFQMSDKPYLSAVMVLLNRDSQSESGYLNHPVTRIELWSEVTTENMKGLPKRVFVVKGDPPRWVEEDAPGIVTHNEDMLTALFYAYWNRLESEGQVSELSRVEGSAIRIAFEWLLKHFSVRART